MAGTRSDDYGWDMEEESVDYGWDIHDEDDEDEEYFDGRRVENRPRPQVVDPSIFESPVPTFRYTPPDLQSNTQDPADTAPGVFPYTPVDQQSSDTEASDTTVDATMDMDTTLDTSRENVKQSQPHCSGR